MQTANSGNLLGMEVEPSLSFKNQDKCSCATVSFFFKFRAQLVANFMSDNFFVLSKIVARNTTSKF